MPKRYDALLSGLLHEFGRLDTRQVAGKSGAETLEIALTRLGREAALRYLDPDAGSRVTTAVRAMREMEFDPEVQHGPGGTRISLNNCPFRSVALSDDAVCSYDSAMLEAILGKPVRRERCISQGHDCCEYFAEAETARPADVPGVTNTPVVNASEVAAQSSVDAKGDRA
jgi:predicted ArsR family transcriptional regulator